MENMQEVSFDELSNISGGGLSHAQILILDAVIERARKEGKEMEWLVGITEDTEAKEYIRKHWA